MFCRPVQAYCCNVERMLRIRDETGNRNESNKQEAELVHQEFIGFIVCILFSFFSFFPLSASKDKEESIPKISKCQ